MYLKSIAAAALALVAATSHAAEGAEKACGAGTCAKKANTAPATEASCAKKEAACSKSASAEAACSKKDAPSSTGSGTPEAACAKKDAACGKK